MHLSAITDEIHQNLRYTWRRAVSQPGFTFAVLTAMALGIGASTAVFSVVDRILFRPLPYAGERELVSLGMTAPISAEEFLLAGDYYDWKERQQSFVNFTAARDVEDCDLTEANPVQLRCYPADYDYLATLGIRPILGRAIEKHETDAVLISHALWQTRFGGQKDILTKSIELDGKRWRVAGVLPADFEVPSLARVDLLKPLGIDEAQQRSRKGPMMFVRAWARLKPGVTVPQANAAMQPVFEHSLQYVPAAFVKEVRLKIAKLRDRQSQSSRAISLALLAAVLCVLSIACANIANLFLARATASQRESAIRAAIGAGRARLVRQQLTESVLLAMLGGVLGIALAAALLEAATWLAPGAIPRLAQSSLDARIAVIALSLTAICGLVTGIAPALRRVDPQALMGTRITSGGNWLRHALVAVQVALATSLLYASTLLGESLWRMQHAGLGIETQNVLVANIALGPLRYPQAAQRAAFWSSLGERVPGIAMSDSLPPSGRVAVMIYSRIRIDGKPEDLRAGTGGMVPWRQVTPEYFKTLGIPPPRFGRLFQPKDRAANPTVVILSEQLAGKLFGTPNAVGRTVQTGPEAPWRTVVGIVRDVRNNGLDDGSPEYYVPLPARPENFRLSLTMRGGRPMQELLRGAVRTLDPHVPLEFQSMDSLTEKLTEGPRFNAAVMGLFSIAGILLGATGIYGVVSFLFTRRTREIGVRMALGATAQGVQGMLLADALRWTLLGCAASIALLAAALPYLKELLYHTQPVRLWSAVAVLAAMALVALLAAWVPAWRASRLDPAGILRHD